MTVYELLVIDGCSDGDVSDRGGGTIGKKQSLGRGDRVARSVQPAHTGQRQHAFGATQQAHSAGRVWDASLGECLEHDVDPVIATTEDRDVSRAHGAQRFALLVDDLISGLQKPTNLEREGFQDRKSVV